jgi:uncharacterized protein YceK
MVESMKTSRNRRSMAGAANTRCQTPARDQRAKRWCKIVLLIVDIQFAGDLLQ